jgi:hypothetical protein
MYHDFQAKVVLFELKAEFIAANKCRRTAKFNAIFYK